MAVELKNAANRYELLEKENHVNLADLKRALDATKETRSKIRDAREELRQAGEIAAGSPYLLRMKPLFGALQTRMRIWKKVRLMRPGSSRIKKIMK